MILLAEVVHPGAIHTQVNSAFLSLVRYAFPGEPVTVIAEEMHAHALAEGMPPDVPRPSFIPFRYYTVPGSPGYWPFKIAGEWRQIISVIRKARRYAPSVLIWTSLFPTGQWMLQLLSRFFLKGQRQVILLHGELEYFNPSLRRPVERLLRFFLRRGLNRSAPQTRFIVFADSIKANLRGQRLQCFDRIYVLPHPYNYNDTAAVQRPAGKQPVVAGTFGALLRRKNSHLFFRLAESFDSDIRSGRIAFHTAGKCEPALKSGNDHVIMHHPETFLPQQMLEDIVSGFDLALFFYDNTAYRLSASGAVHEAIRLGIPVLALRNDYFEWLVRQEEIGILFDDIVQMENFIREVLAGKHELQLEELKKNIRRFRQKHTVAQQARQITYIFSQQ